MPTNNNQVQPMDNQPIQLQRPPDATLQPVQPKMQTQGAAAQPQAARQAAQPQTAQPQTAQPQTAMESAWVQSLLTPNGYVLHGANTGSETNDMWYKSSYNPYYAGQNYSNLFPSVDTQGNSAVDFWLGQYAYQLDPSKRNAYGLGYGTDEAYAAAVDPYVNNEVYGINNDWSAKMMTEPSIYGVMDYGGRRIAKEAILGNQGGPTNEDLYYQMWLNNPDGYNYPTSYDKNNPDNWYHPAGSAAFYADRYSDMTPDERAALQALIYSPKTAAGIAQSTNNWGAYNNPELWASYEQQAAQNRADTIAALQDQIAKNSEAWFNADEEGKKALHNANEGYRQYLQELQMGDDYWNAKEATRAESLVNNKASSYQVQEKLYQQYLEQQAAQEEANRIPNGYAQMEDLLEQWRRAASAQAINAQDYNTQKGVNELVRANEDAAAQFQNERNQVDRNQMNALDNSALYAELRGDNGGIGRAQYDSIQNTAARNHQAIRDAQTKLATDTARQVADLRAQGDFAKADQLLQISQTYLNRLMELEQWGLANGVDITKTSSYAASLAGMGGDAYTVANGYGGTGLIYDNENPDGSRSMTIPASGVTNVGHNVPSVADMIDSERRLSAYNQMWQTWNNNQPVSQNGGSGWAPAAGTPAVGSSNVLDLGMGPISEQTLDNAVQNGSVGSYNYGGTDYFYNTNNGDQSYFDWFQKTRGVKP